MSDEEVHMNVTLPTDANNQGQGILGREIYSIGMKHRKGTNGGSANSNSSKGVSALPQSEDGSADEDNHKMSSSTCMNVQTIIASLESRDESSDVSEDEEAIHDFPGGTNDSLLEDYFTAQSKRSGMTSNNMLTKLSNPTMDIKSIQSALGTIDIFQKDKAALFKEYQSCYTYWLFQLSHGFNILLYGLGSKRNILEDFRFKILHNSCHLVVNGFFPGITVKDILTQLTSEVLGYSGTFKNDFEHAYFIRNTLELSAKEVAPTKSKLQQIPQEIFVIVHNVDGPMLRGDNAQTALSILAQCPSVHFLASIDHINAPLLWDQKKLSRFNWLWHDVTTFEMYKEETSHENSLLVQQSGSLSLSSLIHVNDSLTPNARGIFNLLIRHQLEEKDGAKGTYIGMHYQDCYMKCLEKFLVNSDLTFKTQLTEFYDHKLLKSRKGPDGGEYLLISINSTILSQFLELNSEE